MLLHSNCPSPFPLRIALTSHSMEVPNAALNRIEPGSDSGVAKESGLRAEIDTSVPFGSVKEAVTRFGGVGYWKPNLNDNNNTTKLMILQQHCREELDAGKLEEQAAILERELILKERETLDVLKELESTKRLVENLKSKLQTEESEANLNNIRMSICDDKVHEKEGVKENQVSDVPQHSKEGCVRYPSASTTPGLILRELNQAKLNLNRTTNDIAGVRASVESLNKKLGKETISLEKTRERLTQNSSKITSLEEDLNQTRLKLQVVEDGEIGGCLDDPLVITREKLQRLSSEANHFKRMGEAAKSEVLRAMTEIEQTKAMIRMAEIRLVAARKMKEAARAAEAAAVAEIKALSHCDGDNCVQKQDVVTLSFEEYTALTCKAQDVEEQSKNRFVDAMLQVDESNLSKMDVLKRVEEATEEVKTSKKTLEEALERVEAANRGKLAVEVSLRKWRSEGHKRRPSIHNSTKFKNSHSSHHRRDSWLLDVNGLNVVNDEAKPILKPTLSIGQILSRKLMLPEEFEAGMLRERSSVKRKMSLGQMLGKQNYDPSFDRRQVEKENGQKQFPAKREKFGFARFSLLMTKQQKKKKPTLNLR